MFITVFVRTHSIDNLEDLRRFDEGGVVWANIGLGPTRKESYGSIVWECQVWLPDYGQNEYILDWQDASPEWCWGRADASVCSFQDEEWISFRAEFIVTRRRVN